MEYGVWYGYLAVGILIMVALVVGYLDHKARKQQKRSH